MHVKQWIKGLGKSAGAKKSKYDSPGLAQVGAVSLIVVLAVGAIVLVAHKATPSVSADPVMKSVAAAPAAPVPVPVKRTATAKGKPGNANSSVTAAGAAATAVPDEPVTIVGCLEQKDDAFRLKDTTGSDAPKSRSWKTFGLTKHSASVSLVDTSNRLKLGTHVGERVSVTGMLADKELQGKSLKALSPTCE